MAKVCLRRRVYADAGSGKGKEGEQGDIPDGLTEASLLGTMRHADSSWRALWRYVMAAMHSASIEGTPNTGPQTCSSSIAPRQMQLWEENRGGD